MNKPTQPVQLNHHAYQPPAQALQDKVILVSGAASGIGKAVTIELAKHGATVLMLDKKSRHLEKLSDDILQRGYAEPIILPVDLMEITPESATTLAQAVADEIGHLDGLLHNAAELGSPSPLDQYDMEYWNTVLHTNLQAPYLLTRALLPLLKQEYQTQLIFTSADVGRAPQAYWGAYSIAYAGLEAQMKIWAEELENICNVRVNSIDPGAVRTVLRRRSHPGEDQDSLPTPQSIVPAYLKILSGDHEFHGEQLQVGSAD
ncbi:SDR family NAD(P)-dependent oxidoreductase [Arenicella xantha]|uniref:NAD(P)-dependent dehydrogenase (Short-subunit alcohol dehydrogenase family) n=1 Tax=Arenicella xantha TaxID=644221 RepID=A0A395JNZ5_9GAMM|nr:SDR family NAD(P)-dependent oxidoreductase [Arenicella xantha]RBP51507.1 NAD(P)-dependent dehydrogenase (short-subunit alcohol dehydrogenase family) [Arenicella xantha]